MASVTDNDDAVTGCFLLSGWLVTLVSAGYLLIHFFGPVGLACGGILLGVAVIADVARYTAKHKEQP